MGKFPPSLKDEPFPGKGDPSLPCRVSIKPSVRGVYFQPRRKQGPENIGYIMYFGPENTVFPGKRDLEGRVVSPALAKGMENRKWTVS
jgi:hypothetical protein